MSLFKVKFELFTLTVALALLIFLPVLDALLVPFFHETSVTLELVNLDAAHFLLPHGGHLLVIRVAADGEVLLAILLFFKFLHVRLHVQLLLWLIKRVDARFEELVLHTVVRLLGVCNFLCWLVVAKLTSFG